MLIGIAGTARSGKGTIANHLRNKYGFTVRSFADPLKDMLTDLFGLDPCYFHRDDLKEAEIPHLGKTPRWLMQRFGTEFARDIDENVWVKSLARDYRRELQENGDVRCIVPDVRFVNEHLMIRQLGGVLWKVCRNNHHGASGGIENHRSEVEINQLPNSSYSEVFCVNEGELDLLRSDVDQALAEEFGTKEFE